MLRAYQHRRVTLVALLATALSIAFPSVCRAQSSRRQMELIRNLPDNAHVLYALGDLNGDGFVDRRDLAILRDIVAKPSAPMPAAARCPAAGDVNLDRKLDSSDVDELAGWLKNAPRLDTPALYWQSGLACELTQPFLAATLDPRAGETFLIRFLDPSYTTSNVHVEVHSGPATIRPAPDGKGYVGRISPDAKSGDLAILLISIPGNRHYYYDLQVRSAVGQSK
jgi:Dockerin type I domain